MEKFVFLYNGSGWFLKIDSLDMLNRYMKKVWNIRKEEFFYDLKRIRKKQHPTGDIAQVCQTLSSMKGTDAWLEFLALKENQHREMSYMVLEGLTLYVNSSGGYCMLLENITNRYESETLMWPVFSEDDIRIKKWPGGTHYYAYIGPVQVKDGDILKWDSESDARMAAKKYVNRKRPSMK